MKAGLLRSRCTIQQRPAVGRDSFGEKPSDNASPLDPNWQNFAISVPCAINALKGRELYEASKLYAEAEFVINIRYIAGIDTGMRVVAENLVYDIRAAIDPDSKKRELQLFCRILK